MDTESRLVIARGREWRVGEMSDCLNKFRLK